MKKSCQMPSRIFSFFKPTALIKALPHDVFVSFANFYICLIFCVLPFIKKDSPSSPILNYKLVVVVKARQTGVFFSMKVVVIPPKNRELIVIEGPFACSRIILNLF